MGLSLPIALARDMDATLQEQIYRQVRDGILAGSLGPGLKLPSSRDMASELAVSRNTVALAFDWLASEGYVESRVGAAPSSPATCRRQHSMRGPACRHRRRPPPPSGGLR